MGLIGGNMRNIELPKLSQVLRVPPQGAYIMYNSHTFFSESADRFNDPMVCGLSADVLERVLRGAIHGSMVQALELWDDHGPSQVRADIFSALTAFCEGRDADYSQWGCEMLGSRACRILKLPVALTKFLDQWIYEIFEGVVQGQSPHDLVIDCFRWVRLSKVWPYGDQRIQISLTSSGCLMGSCNLYCSIGGEARGNIYQIYEKSMADQLCSEYILALLMFDVRRAGF